MGGRVLRGCAFSRANYRASQLQYPTENLWVGRGLAYRLLLPPPPVSFYTGGFFPQLAADVTLAPVEHFLLDNGSDVDRNLFPWISWHHGDQLELIEALLNNIC